ncbi:MAG: hypothetical protein ACUBOA_11080 [Candidatus Loosdrechtia sp.]|nr:MAG: hypothetical protein QY305_11845 [Candidatus Jettenia sp. AMX2]
MSLVYVNTSNIAATVSLKAAPGVGITMYVKCLWFTREKDGYGAI